MAEALRSEADGGAGGKSRQHVDRMEEEQRPIQVKDPAYRKIVRLKTWPPKEAMVEGSGLRKRSAREDARRPIGGRLAGSPAYRESTARFRGPRWIGKPDSVPPCGLGRHSSGMDVAIHLKQPTRRLDRANPH